MKAHVRFVAYSFCTLNSHQLLPRSLALAGHQWLVPIILATQEAEIRRIVVRSQSQKIVCKTLSQKYPTKK
jgi:hypothetical protein